MTTKPNFAIELTMMPSDGVTAPLRFGRQRFGHSDRIRIRQSSSWIAIPVDDIDQFIAGIEEVEGLDATKAATPAQAIARKGW